MRQKGGKISYRDTGFAYALLAPSLILLLLLIGYPMLYNILISFQKVPINPRMESAWVGFQNYTVVLKDESFYHSVGITLLFTLIVTVVSTVFGLVVAVWLNRDFVGKKIVNSVIILSYVVPAVCLIFTWRYLFNNIYGLVNFLIVDVLHFSDEVPLWFDRPVSAFALVAFFAVWKFYPYAYMSFTAILQSIDKNLYEAAEIDGANGWEKFLTVTYPAIQSTLVTVVSLRTIWVFYIYAEVYLLTKQTKVLGVYLYDMAFSTHDFGRAAAISILLFGLIFGLIMLIRKKVLKTGED